MKGLYRKLSMLLLVAMLFSMLGPVGVYATDVTTEAQPQATEQVGTSAPVEETDVNAQETTGEIVVDPAPVEVEGEVAPKVSQEVAAEPTASAATETDGQATADQKTEEASQEQGSEAEKETKELTFFEQLMELKTCKEIYETLNAEGNEEQVLALTKDQLNSLKTYVAGLPSDETTEELMSEIEYLITGENGTELLKFGENNINSVGTGYDHIDVKVDSKYSINLDGKTYNISATVDKKSLKVRVGSTTYDFANTITQGESGQNEYHKEARLSATDITWVDVFSMTNVYVTAKLIVDTTTTNFNTIKDYLSKDGNGNYYIQLTDYQYKGIQECTGGNGMRSSGNTGTATGLDLYITAAALQNYISKGKMGIKKVIVDENGHAVADNTQFTFKVTGPNNFSQNVTVVGNQTATLDNLATGAYTITEIQKDGYIIKDADGSTGTYTIDYTVENKTESEIPVATFTNTKLSNKGGVSIKKLSNKSISPTVSIYAVDSDGAATGSPLWTGTVTAGGDRIYLRNYLAAGTYAIVETNYEITGQSCVTTLEVNGKLQNGLFFTVSAGTVTALDLTNTYSDYVTKDITVKKVWNDEDNNDGIRPGSVTVHLYSDNQDTGKTVTLNADNKWTATFTGLTVGPEYTVKEDAVNGYTPSITVDANTGFTITNTHTPEKTTLTVTKVWDDDDNKYKTRLTDVEVQLYYCNEDGVQTNCGDPVKLNEDGTYTFSNLWKYYNGKPITWGVEEVVKDNSAYNPTYKYNNDGTVVTVTNTLKLDNEVPVTKIWDDNSNQDGKRPGSITVTLKVNGVVFATTNKDTEWTKDGNKWKYTFKNVPAGEYTIEEEAVTDYTTTVDQNTLTITNTHTPATTSVSGTKTWDDKNNQDGIRPESVTVNLLANGKKVASKTVTEKDGWKYTFTDLDKFENGKEIVYTVTEEAVKGYTAKVDGYNITNTHEPEKLEGGVSGTKTWNDKNNQDGVRPESITVNLLANGKKIDSKTVTEKDGWKYTFTDLDKYENGKKIVYTVTEEAVKGYTAKVDGYNITNTHETETTVITVEKKWVDNNDKEGKRPGEITVQLYANGVKLGDAVKITAKDGWKYEFKDLDKYANGKLVEYTVKETSEKYYVAKYTAKDDVLTITNTFVDIPLTGDTINLLFWTMMVLGAGAVLGGMGFFFRRRRT